MEAQRQFSISQPIEIPGLYRFAHVVPDGVGAVVVKPCLVEMDKGVSKLTEETIDVFSGNLLAPHLKVIKGLDRLLATHPPCRQPVFQYWREGPRVDPGPQALSAACCGVVQRSRGAPIRCPRESTKPSVAKC
jgi:hypothetical protein